MMRCCALAARVNSASADGHVGIRHVHVRHTAYPELAYPPIGGACMHNVSARARCRYGVMFYAVCLARSYHLGTCPPVDEAHVVFAASDQRPAETGREHTARVDLGKSGPRAVRMMACNIVEDAPALRTRFPWNGGCFLVNAGWHSAFGGGTQSSPLETKWATQAYRWGAPVLATMVHFLQRCSSSQSFEKNESAAAPALKRAEGGSEAIYCCCFCFWPLAPRHYANRLLGLLCVWQ